MKNSNQQAQSIKLSRLWADFSKVKNSYWEVNISNTSHPKWVKSEVNKIDPDIDVNLDKWRVAVPKNKEPLVRWVILFEDGSTTTHLTERSAKSYLGSYTKVATIVKMVEETPLTHTKDSTYIAGFEEGMRTVMDKVDKLEKYLTKNNNYDIAVTRNGFCLWDDARSITFKKSDTLLGLVDE